jgi:hypothetical protein
MTGDVFLCLDCQQAKPILPEGGTGYAVLGDRDPSESGHFVCYACSEIRERADFANANRYAAYLSSDGGRVTTWTGGMLATVTNETKRRVGFGTDGRTYIRATASDGSQWYGNGPGRGMFLRLRRKASK